MQKYLNPFVALAFAVSITPAFAAANFGCQAEDKNIASLTLEGLTPRDGTSLDKFEGMIELKSGNKIDLAQSDVRKFSWKKTLRLHIRKKLAGRAFVELQIRARQGEDGISMPGRYILRTEKIRGSGKVSCEGG